MGLGLRLGLGLGLGLGLSLTFCLNSVVCGSPVATMPQMVPG